MDFFYGGIGCCLATIFVHPLDTIKVRIQIRGERLSFSSLEKSNLIINLIRKEGWFVFWKGLSPSLLREASYSTLRIGLYHPIKSMLHQSDSQVIPLWKRSLAGACSGLLGAAIANPTDLVKVRMQASSIGTQDSVWRCFRNIWIREGLPGLYRGVIPTTLRAAILTSTQLTCYDQSKQSILAYGNIEEGIGVHFVASFIAGFFATTTSSPFDVIKSKYMNQEFSSQTGRGILYSSTYDCFLKTVRQEGIFALMKGWTPQFLRLGPHTILTFIFVEQLRKLSGLKPF